MQNMRTVKIKKESKDRVIVTLALKICQYYRKRTNAGELKYIMQETFPRASRK